MNTKEKRKRGRPKSELPIKVSRVTFRLTPEVMKRLEAAAKAENKKVGTFLNDLVEAST